MTLGKRVLGFASLILAVLLGGCLEPDTSTLDQALATDFTVTIDPAVMTLGPGTVGTAKISTSGTAQTLVLSVSNAPTGITPRFTPTTITVGQSSQLTLSIDAATVPGTYALAVTATGSSGSFVANLQVVVSTNDFSLAVVTPVEIVAGASGVATVTTAVTAGSAQSVALVASGLPAGVVASFSPSPVTSGGGSTLTLSVGSSVAPGTYAVTVSGVGSSATHTASLELTVLAPPANDFSIAATPATITVAPFATGTATISSAVVSGAPQSLFLTAAGQPAGISTSFTPSPIVTGGSATLAIQVGAVPSGTYPLTVTATGASGSHTTTVTVVVAPIVNDFAITTSTPNLSINPGGQVTATIATTVISGGATSVSLTAAIPAGFTASLAPPSITAGGSSMLTIEVAPAVAAGTYTVSVTGTAPTASHTVAITVVVAGPIATGLHSGVTVSGLSSRPGGQRLFSINVPRDQRSLTVAMTGGTGDADLYVRLGAAPTLAAFDCRPYTSSSTESCTMTPPPAGGTYFILVHGFTAYSNVSLTATYVPLLTTLFNGITVTGLADVASSSRNFVLHVPANHPPITVHMFGGTGDADLYVRFGAAPTTATWDCRPFLTGNNETCTFPAAVAAADVYVMLHGFTAYAGASLTASY